MKMDARRSALFLALLLVGVIGLLVIPRSDGTTVHVPEEVAVADIVVAAVAEVEVEEKVQEEAPQKFEVLDSCPTSYNGTIVFNSANGSFTFCATTTTLVAGTLFQATGSTTNISFSGSPPSGSVWRLVMDAGSKVDITNSARLAISAPTLFTGSGTVNIDSSGNALIQAATEFGAPTNVLGYMYVGNSSTFTRTLTVSGRIDIAAGQTMKIQQPIAWSPSVFADNSVLNTSQGALLYITSGRTNFNQASITAPMTLEGGTAATTAAKAKVAAAKKAEVEMARRSAPIDLLTNGTVNPVVRMCGTPDFGFGTTGVSNGAGLSVGTQCAAPASRLTFTGSRAAAYTSYPVEIKSGGWLIFEWVNLTSRPLTINNLLTLQPGSRIHAIVAYPIGEYLLPLVQYKGTCYGDSGITASIDGCNVSGCAIVNTSTSSYCQLSISHGSRFISGTYTITSLLPCGSFDAAFFYSLVAVYVPGSAPHIATNTTSISCGSMIVNFACFGATQAMAEGYCSAIAENGNLKSALSAVNPNVKTSDSNGGLYALFALFALPLVFCVMLCCQYIAPRLRKHEEQRYQELPHESDEMYSIMDNYNPQGPINHFPTPAASPVAPGGVP